jgi:hypothetical protein
MQDSFSPKAESELDSGLREALKLAQSRLSPTHRIQNLGCLSPGQCFI